MLERFTKVDETFLDDVKAYDIITWTFIYFSEKNASLTSFMVSVLVGMVNLLKVADEPGVSFDIYLQKRC